MATLETRTQGDRCVRGHFRLTAIAYLRVSTDEQDLGIDAQRQAVAEAAERHSLTIRDTFVDVVSGGLRFEARTTLLEAVAELHRGEILLVARRDRLGRDPLAIGMIEHLVKKRRARIVSAAGQGCGIEDDPDDLNNLLMRRIFDAFAEHERLLIALRTKHAMHVLKADGLRTGTLPFGTQLGQDGKHLEPAPVEQRIKTTIAALAASVHSTKEIADTLNADGFTTRRGTPWRPAYVARQLRKVAG